MQLNPSPPPDASASNRGLVNTIAQTFQGAKTFLADVLVSGIFSTTIMFAQIVNAARFSWTQGGSEIFWSEYDGTNLTLIEGDVDDAPISGKVLTLVPADAELLLEQVAFNAQEIRTGNVVWKDDSGDTQARSYWDDATGNLILADTALGGDPRAFIADSDSALHAPYGLQTDLDVNALGNINAEGHIGANGNLFILGDAQINNNLEVDGAANIDGSITAANLSGTNTGNVTLTTVGATPNSDGASLAGQALTLQPANSSNPGLLTALAQLIGGIKTFAANTVHSLGAQINGAFTWATSRTAMMNFTPPVSGAGSGNGTNNPVLNFEITSTNPTRMIRFGNAASEEFWMGYYGAGGVPLLGVRSSGLLFEAPSGGWLAPANPSVNDLGVSTNSWRRVWANSTYLGETISNGTHAGFAYNVGAAMLGMWSPNLATYLGINIGSGLASCSGGFTSAGALTGVGGVVAGATAAVMQTTGRIDQSGTNSAASPGAVTINKPTGISAIASGAGTVTITCSECTTASRVMLTPLENATDNAEFWNYKVKPQSGSFIVSIGDPSGGPATASEVWPFSWEISRVL